MVASTADEQDRENLICVTFEVCMATQRKLFTKNMHANLMTPPNDLIRQSEGVLMLIAA